MLFLFTIMCLMMTPTHGSGRARGKWLAAFQTETGGEEIVALEDEQYEELEDIQHNVMEGSVEDIDEELGDDEGGQEEDDDEDFQIGGSASRSRTRNRGGPSTGSAKADGTLKVGAYVVYRAKKNVRGIVKIVRGNGNFAIESSVGKKKVITNVSEEQLETVKCQAFRAYELVSDLHEKAKIAIKASRHMTNEERTKYLRPVVTILWEFLDTTKYGIAHVLIQYEGKLERLAKGVSPIGQQLHKLVTSALDFRLTSVVKHLALTLWKGFRAFKTQTGQMTDYRECHDKKSKLQRCKMFLTHTIAEGNAAGLTFLTEFRTRMAVLRNFFCMLKKTESKSIIVIKRQLMKNMDDVRKDLNVKFQENKIYQREVKLMQQRRQMKKELANVIG